MATYLTRQDVENFGSELVDLTQRSALHTMEPHLQEIERQNDELRAQLARETKRNLDAALEREVPDWQAINRDPRWFEWLAGVHEFSGYTRQQLLNDAVNKGDAHRVISIFRGFLREQGVAEHGASPERSPRRRPTTNKPVYTRAEITRRAALRRRGA